MSDILKENENLRREILSMKVGENFAKNRKPILIDRQSIVYEKNLVDNQKLQQAKLDLEAEQTILSSKIEKLQAKIFSLSQRNEELEKF
jgi:hypothetical protein